MLNTRITERYGLKVPLINAGMAFIATVPLVQAVCKAGGMGMLGIPAMPPDVLRAVIRDIRVGDPACFGVDIIARFSGIEHIEVCVSEKVPVVVFFWDDVPEEWLSRLRAAGSHIWFQVGSVDEAKAALRHGAQGLVVQGSEAGGHNRAAAATFSLLPAVIDAVPSIPVVAAGGVELPTAAPLLPRWRSALTQSGWGHASSRASRPMPINSTRIELLLRASEIRLGI